LRRDRGQIGLIHEIEEDLFRNRFTGLSTRAMGQRNDGHCKDKQIRFGDSERSQHRKPRKNNFA
jgi:hypothetical protein